jgi:hypothetical protein
MPAAQIVSTVARMNNPASVEDQKITFLVIEVDPLVMSW